MTLLRASLLALPAVLALQSDRVTFDAPRDYYVESYAVVTGDVNGDGDLAAALYNGDGKPDLAVVNDMRRYFDEGGGGPVVSVKVIRLLTNTSPAASP